MSWWMPVGDHENGPKNNQDGAVENVAMRGNLLEENIVFHQWT